MDTRTVLSVAAGVFFGYCGYAIIYGTIKGVIEVSRKKMELKMKKIHQERQTANHAGRVIGFRPIEQEVRA